MVSAMTTSAACANKNKMLSAAINSKTNKASSVTTTTRRRAMTTTTRAKVVGDETDATSSVNFGRRAAMALAGAVALRAKLARADL
jgi:hypothetical protein